MLANLEPVIARGPHGVGEEFGEYIPIFHALCQVGGTA